MAISQNIRVLDAAERTVWVRRAVLPRAVWADPIVAAEFEEEVEKNTDFDKSNCGDYGPLHGVEA